jgi:taurine dioxygenase
MTGLRVTPEPGGFGACIEGVDLCRPGADLDGIEAAFVRHGVVYFPNQAMGVEDLERFTLALGGFGEDPYVAPMAGHPHVLEVRREPDETGFVFGAAWHSDWSFQETPPAATLLYGEVIPPVGGDTLFADGEAAYAALSETMKAMLAPLRAIHSAGRAYGPNSGFARETGRKGMIILTSESAEARRAHPLVRTHPASGRKTLFVNPVYTVGVEGLTETESAALLGFLFKHMLRKEFIFRHHWTAGTLAMWDNRRAMHLAEGGYEGHLRVMRRTTLRGDAPV